MVVLRYLTTLLLFGAWASAIDFQKDIRPILSKHCFHCHGPDSENRQASLRLDSQVGVLAQSKRGAIVKPGSLEESLLWKRVAHPKAALRMPPPSAHKDLNESQKQLLAKWIEAGAPWAEHWSFRAPRASPLPAVKQRQWPRNPIDHFVLARLEREGLAPAPEENKSRLLRRLSLDLTGLPPTPAETARFLRDPDPSAYERMVDHYLASPHWGEHRARYWMDAARYGDTHGLHSDNAREMWLWRDWVIRAFQSNMPFDQFTREQLAGDLLPDATWEQRIATGFHRNHIATGEGGVIAEEVRAIYIKDQVDTTAAVWLGLTLGCASCHDHKYDPVSQEDFYRMAAFFNNTTERIIHGEISEPEPTVMLPAAADRPRWAVLEKELKQKRMAWQQWLSRSAEACSSSSAPWQPAQQLLRDQASDGELSWQRPFSVRLRFGEVDRHFTLLARSQGPGGSVQIALESFLPVVRLQSPDGKRSIQVRANSIRVAPASQKEQEITVTWDALGRPEGLNIYVGAQAAYLSLLPNPAWQGPQSERKEDLKVERLTWPRVLSSEEILLAVEPASKDSQPILCALYGNTEARLAFTQWQAAEAEYRAFRLRGHVSLVLEEKPGPATARILKRGQYDQPAAEVLAGTPSALPLMDPALPRNRLGLAEWLLSPANPLTARVAVNRFWLEIFGTGIVKSAEDFGATGDPPTHQELLDWLAVEFRNSGWDVKKLIRLMVSSATYRQAAQSNETKQRLDPENRLLSRGPRFRMDAEMLRDSMLAQSALLVPKIGGPSVRPRQPAGVWESVAVLFSNTRYYAEDPGEARYRRSLYTYWKRGAPAPAMEIFNAPTRETCTVRRERTNTPLQALVVLNDLDFVEAAAALARQAVAQRSGLAARLNWISERVLNRRLDGQEQQTLHRHFQRLRQHFVAHPHELRDMTGTPDANLAAYIQLASLIMNLDEALTK